MTTTPSLIPEFPGSPKSPYESQTEWAIRQVKEHGQHQILADLYERVERANLELCEQRDRIAPKSGIQSRRLEAKAQGVRLVRGYIEEAIRELLHSNNAPAGFEGPWAG